MAQVKDEAFYEAQAAASALALARLRRPKLEAALAMVDDLATRMADLTAQRDALHDGPTKLALGHVISILTSAPGMVTAEIAALPKESAA